MKKRIFVSAHYMEIGGAETALVGLLNAFDPARVDVDLFICDHRGPMMQFIPEWINVLPPISAYTMLERPIREVILKGFWSIALSRLYGKVRSRIEYKRSGSTLPNMSSYGYTDQMIKRFMPIIDNTTQYDLAINFIGPNYIITDKIKARKTISWIHSDYTKQWVGNGTKKAVCPTTYIASISDDVTKTFLEVYPLYASNIVLIENILSPVFVRKRAEMFDVESELMGERIFKRLLSIGRFCEAKNYDNVPDICRRVVASGCDVKWYIIGFGVDELLIRQKIAESGMQDHVIILGKKENPYPYIKACDFYVQPSRYEGKSVTVREAQMLCKPVVVTNYPTAGSQIQDGIDGVIVPMDNEGCAKGLAEYILDKEKQTHIIEYLHTHDYGNESEVEKIYDLIEQ